VIFGGWKRSRPREWGSGGRWFESSRPDLRKSRIHKVLRILTVSQGLWIRAFAEMRCRVAAYNLQVLGPLPRSKN
jgi:hypothetical protein